MTVELNRKDLETFRRVCSKALGWRRNNSGWCYLTPHPDGVTLSVSGMTAAVSYVIPCDYCDEPLVLPWEAITELASKKNGSVTLTKIRDANQLRADWLANRIPRTAVYAVPESLEPVSEFPAPDNFVENPVGFVNALNACSRVTGEQNALRALHCVALRPESGSLVATDGSEIFLESGFSIPGDKLLLVPANSVFSCPELRQSDTVRIGVTERHFVLQTGSWTVAIRLCDKGQYPNVDHVLPSQSTTQTRMHIDPEDAAFLTQALKSLPASDSTHQPVTVDLNGRVSLRAKGKGENDLVELILAKSSYEGEPVRVSVNRNHLGRAVRLGFREIAIKNTRSPIVARDDLNREYGWMPLVGGVVQQSSPNAVRISSVPEDSIREAVPQVEGTTRAASSVVEDEPASTMAESPNVLSGLAQELRNQISQFQEVLTRLHNTLQSVAS